MKHMLSAIDVELSTDAPVTKLVMHPQLWWRLVGQHALNRASLDGNFKITKQKTANG